MIFFSLCKLDLENEVNAKFQFNYSISFEAIILIRKFQNAPRALVSVEVLGNIQNGREISVIL